MSILSTLTITAGLWRAVLFTPGGELPFQMKVTPVGNTYSFAIINGAEEMPLGDVVMKSDSIFVKFPVYEAELRLKVNNDKELEGEYINLTRITHASIRMKATAGDAPRFNVRSKTPVVDVTGRWQVQFSPGMKDSSSAVGIFEQKGTKVTGTFLTKSGDYRYLEGAVDHDSLYISTFDGVFVYLFKAKVEKEKLSGIFYSGTHRQVNFEGIKNDKAMLPDAASLTKYNTDSIALNFRLPDLDSNLVSLDDPKFKNKVVLLQILGSWCPNCLDESAFLAPYYDKNKDRGVEIIGLSFEKTDDFKHAVANVRRFQDRLGIHYTLLIAANREKIKTVLPGLENFVGFPTSIYLDKNHKVRKVYAGFSGAATGAEYEKFKKEFTEFMDSLLRE